MKAFVSRLGPAMSDFLSYKHALGNKYTSASVYLRELDLYNATHGDHHTLVKEIVDGWNIQQNQPQATGVGYRRSVNLVVILLIQEILALMYWIIHSSSNGIIRMST